MRNANTSQSLTISRYLSRSVGHRCLTAINKGRKVAVSLILSSFLFQSATSSFVSSLPVKPLKAPSPVRRKCVTVRDAGIAKATHVVVQFAKQVDVTALLSEVEPASYALAAIPVLASGVVPNEPVGA